MKRPDYLTQLLLKQNSSLIDKVTALFKRDISDECKLNALGFKEGDRESLLEQLAGKCSTSFESYQDHYQSLETVLQFVVSTNVAHPDSTEIKEESKSVINHLANSALDSARNRNYSFLLALLHHVKAMPVTGNNASEKEGLVESFIDSSLVKEIASVCYSDYFSGVDSQDLNGILELLRLYHNTCTDELSHVPGLQDFLKNKEASICHKISRIVSNPGLTDEVKVGVLIQKNQVKPGSNPSSFLSLFFFDVFQGGKDKSTQVLFDKILSVISKNDLATFDKLKNIISSCMQLPSFNDIDMLLSFMRWVDQVPVSFCNKIEEMLEKNFSNPKYVARLKEIDYLLKTKASYTADDIHALIGDGSDLSELVYLKLYRFYSGGRRRNGAKVNSAEVKVYAKIKAALGEFAELKPDFLKLKLIVDSRFDLKAQLIGSKKHHEHPKNRLRQSLLGHLDRIISSDSDFSLGANSFSLIKFLFDQGRGSKKVDWNNARASGLVKTEFCRTTDELLAVFGADKAISRVALPFATVKEYADALSFSVVVMSDQELKKFLNKHRNIQSFKSGLKRLGLKYVKLLLHRLLDFSDYHYFMAIFKLLPIKNLKSLGGLDLLVKAYVEITRIVEALSVLGCRDDESARALNAVLNLINVLKQALIESSSKGSDLKVSALMHLKIKEVESLSSFLKSKGLDQDGIDTFMDSLGSLSVLSEINEDVGAKEQESIKLDVDIFSMDPYQLINHLRSISTKGRENCFNRVGPKSGLCLLSFVLKDHNFSEAAFKSVFNVLKTLGPDKLVDYISEKDGPSQGLKLYFSDLVHQNLSGEHSIYLAKKIFDKYYAKKYIRWNGWLADKVRDAVVAVEAAYRKNDGPSNEQVMELLVALHNAEAIYRPSSWLRVLLLALGSNFNLGNCVNKLSNPSLLKKALWILSGSEVSHAVSSKAVLVNLKKKIAGNGSSSIANKCSDIKLMTGLADVALELKLLLADYEERTGFAPSSGGIPIYMGDGAKATHRRPQPKKQAACEMLLQQILYAQRSLTNHHDEGFHPSMRILLVLRALNKHPSWAEIIRGTNLYEQLTKLDNLLVDYEDSGALDKALTGLLRSASSLVDARAKFENNVILSFIANDYPAYMTMALSIPRFVKALPRLCVVKELVENKFLSLLERKAGDFPVSALLNLLSLSWKVKSPTLLAAFSKPALVAGKKADSNASNLAFQKYERVSGFIGFYRKLDALFKSYSKVSEDKKAESRASICRGLMGCLNDIIDLELECVGNSRSLQDLIDKLSVKLGVYLLPESNIDEVVKAEMGASGPLRDAIRQLKDQLGEVKLPSFADILDDMKPKLSDRGIYFGLLLCSIGVDNAVINIVKKKPQLVLMGLQYAVSHQLDAFCRKFPELFKQCSDILDLKQLDGCDLLHYALSRESEEAVKCILTAILSLPIAKQADLLARSYKHPSEFDEIRSESSGDSEYLVSSPIYQEMRAIDHPMVQSLLQGWAQSDANGSAAKILSQAKVDEMPALVRQPAVKLSGTRPLLLSDGKDSESPRPSSAQSPGPVKRGPKI